LATDYDQHGNLRSGHIIMHFVSPILISWILFLFIYSGDDNCDQGKYRNLQSVFGWSLWAFPVSTLVRPIDDNVRVWHSDTRTYTRSMQLFVLILCDAFSYTCFCSGLYCLFNKRHS
jgi:hypothetical protein